MSSKHTTIVSLLRRWAHERPESAAFTFLPDGDDLPMSLAFVALDVRARAIAAYLQTKGGTGARALLFYPNGLDFVAAYLGCLYAGVVPVPSPPPTRPFRRVLPRIRGIVESCTPRFAIAHSSTVSFTAHAFGDAPELASLEWIANDEVSLGLADEWREPSIDADTLGVVQYTSGSTSVPKGVLVTHGNLLQSCSMLDRAWNHDETSVMVSWLPTFHDMGLVYGMLTPLFKGFHCVMMTPGSFVRRPVRWLEALTRHRGTHAIAPNFGYDLCVRKIASEQCGALDLSSWRVAASGAEPIRKQTLESFCNKFRPYWLRRTSMVTAYGLAESTLAVTGSSPDRFPTIVEVERDGEPNGVRSVVSVGSPLADTVIAIVDPESRLRHPDGKVGEVWIGGPSVAKGYLGLENETARTFHARVADTGEGPFLRTGDLGFMRDGELYICGRLKDLIIVRGRNHHPEDIEATVERSHPSVRLSSTAAIGIDDDGEEQLVLLVELEKNGAREDIAAVTESIRSEIAFQHEIEPARIVFLQAGTIARTSSGKIQRASCRAAYRERTLSVIQAASAAPMTEAIVSDLRAEIARLARLPIDKVGDDVVLNRLGLDSVRFAELSTFLERRCGLIVPPARLLDDVTLRDLPGMLLRPKVEPIAAPALPRSREASTPRAPKRSGAMDLSLFFFANDDSTDGDRYRLLVEATKLCDARGFHAAWIPERHFHPFGGVFPNPAVAAAALATITSRIRLRAGSVVLPLHDPLRVAEEWSLVDNLSNGRVDIAFASGWAANDFVLFPRNFPERRQVNLQGIETVKRLWRGEALTMPNGVGQPFDARIFPRPIQSELDTWLTCTGGIDGFVEAGSRGHHVLTALLFQTVDELAARISVYRSARAANGHDRDAGRVTLMMHTFIGNSVEGVRQTVRGPFMKYLRSSIDLWRNEFAHLDGLSTREQEAAIDAAFERYSSRNALFGTPATCRELLARLKQIGVDEIACLIDFGVDTDTVLAALDPLEELRRLAETP